VNIDMSGSSDPDGTVQWYYFICDGAFAPASQNPRGTCTFTQPGTYWVALQIQDNSGQVDLISAYVVATPTGAAGAGDATPPTVSVQTPSEGAGVTGAVGLTASASDNSGAVTKIEYRLDAPNGILIGSSTGS